jgi:flagellar biosynthesis chaperone FliJ
MESRPLRLAPDVAKAIEERLRTLSGKKLEQAQDAILVVYQSGQQMTTEQWITAYESAIITALGGVSVAA